MLLQISSGHPLRGGVKYLRVGIFVTLEINCHLSRIWYEIGPWFLYGSLVGIIGSRSFRVGSNDLE